MTWFPDRNIFLSVLNIWPRVFRYGSISIDHSLLCNDILDDNFVSFFCVIILCNSFAPFSCVIISCIPPFLLLSSLFHSPSLALSLSLSHRHTHIYLNATYDQMRANVYYLSFFPSLSLIVCLSLFLSSYLLLYFALFTRSPFGRFY